MAEDGEPKAAEERGTKKIQRRAGFSSQENRWLECTRVNGLGSWGVGAQIICEVLK